MTPAFTGPNIPPFGLNDNDSSFTFVPNSTPVYPQLTQVSSQPLSQPAPAAHLNRFSALSLIDLDASLAIDVTDALRPSTAGSDAASTSSDLKAPFDLEPHGFSGFGPRREPSNIHVSEDMYASSPPTAQAQVSSSPPQRTASDSDANHYQIPRMPSPLDHHPPAAIYVRDAGLQFPGRNKGGAPPHDNKFA
jgi:hypothetical protein